MSEAAVFAAGKFGSVARQQATLRAALIPVDVVPLALQLVGLDVSRWPLTTMSGSEVVYVYLARSPQGELKIGMSRDVANRMDQLRMEPLALVRFAQRAHEARLHVLLAAERLKGELFSGPKTEALLAAVTGLAVVRFGETDAATDTVKSLRDAGHHPELEPVLAKLFPVNGQVNAPRLSHARSKGDPPTTHFSWEVS